MNVVPPEVGAVHQVNLEYLSKVVQVSEGFIYPDSVVGTDSHTTMINGLGILGWGESTHSTLCTPPCSLSHTATNHFIITLDQTSLSLAPPHTLNFLSLDLTL